MLVVEDDRPLAELYATTLDARYDVQVAHSGEAALDALDPEPDVVLLDRGLADVTGDEVLEVIQDRAVDARVAMVTGVEPDFDIIEFGIDEYLVKPVDAGALRDAVDRLLTLDDLREKQAALSSKRLKRNLLEVEKSDAALDENEEFRRLEREIERLESEVDALESTLPAPDTSNPVVG